MGLFANRSIGLKLILSLLTGVLLIFFLAFFYNYRVSRSLILSQTQENMDRVYGDTLVHIENVLRAVETAVKNLAYLLEHSSYQEGDLMELIASLVKNYEEIYGSTIAYAPYAFDRDKRLFAPYVYRKGKDILITSLAGPEYQYPDWDWYKIPKQMGHPLWSEPYFDRGGGNTIMSTYSAPFSCKEAFCGVVTADIALDWLQEMVSNIRIGRTGYAFILSKQGCFISHPDKHLIMDQSIFSLAKQQQDPELSRIGQRMVHGESGSVTIISPVDQEEKFLFYAPFTVNDWSLGIVVDTREVMADVNQLSRIVLLIALAGIAVLVALVMAVARSITRPLARLSRASDHIANGNLNTVVPPVSRQDELGRLTGSFIAMQQALKDHIRRLKETTAAKERIESELKIAHNIQMGMLTRQFPSCPELNIHALCQPAKEVGGDLYDVFPVQDSLALVIGDVSGKGVPAALFMAMTKTLLSAAAKEGLSLSEVMAHVNNELADNNPSSLFVTLFLAALDGSSGRVDFVNAGHNPPLLVRQGQARMLSCHQNLVVGVKKDFRYQSGSLDLLPGDFLLLYTDGVTEAQNSDRDMFDESRLCAVMETAAGGDAKHTLLRVLRAVQHFCADVPQYDDITMLGLAYAGGGYPVG